MSGPGKGKWSPRPQISGRAVILMGHLTETLCCIRDVTRSPTARGTSPAPAAGFVLLCDFIHESRHSEPHELQEALRRVLLDQGMKARIQQHHLDLVLSMHQRVKQTIYQPVDLPLRVSCLPASTRQCRRNACMVHKRCMVRFVVHRLSMCTPCWIIHARPYSSNASPDKTHTFSMCDSVRLHAFSTRESYGLHTFSVNVPLGRHRIA